MMSLFGLRVNRLVGIDAPPRPTKRLSGGGVWDGGLRDAMARSVHGVAIVSTDGPGGRAGITVTSVVSVSLEPPLILVSIHHRTRALAAITRNGTFVVNLLAARHRALADVFAGRPDDGAPHDFGRARWVAGVRGSPVLADALVSLECELFRSDRAGTHQLVIGRCIGIRTGDGPPLLYTERQYGIPHVAAPAVLMAREAPRRSLPRVDTRAVPKGTASIHPLYTERKVV